MTKPSDQLAVKLRSHARYCRSEAGSPFHDIYIGKCFDDAADALEFLQREFDCAVSTAQRNRDEIERLMRYVEALEFVADSHGLQAAQAMVRAAVEPDPR